MLVNPIKAARVSYTVASELRTEKLLGSLQIDCAVSHGQTKAQDL